MAVKRKIGTVISDKLKKTRIVLVSERGFQKKYKKVILVNKRYSVHDVSSTSFIGDQVIICKTSRISKTKDWNLSTVLKKFSK